MSRKLVSPYGLFLLALLLLVVTGALSLPVALGLGAGLILLFLLTSRLLREHRRLMLELTLTTRRVSEGREPEKVYWREGGPEGDLVEAFEHMLHQLLARIAELEEQQQRLRTVLGAMVEGVLALDAGQRVLFVNDRARDLLDLSDSAAGRDLRVVVRHRTVIDVCARALREARPQEKELTWHGHEHRSLNVYAAPLPGEPPTGVVLVIHDTSELRRLERLRQDFVANVSHELKTPLAVIRPCVETLLNGAMEDPVHGRRFLEQITLQTERLHSLILDLLSLARVESGSEVFSMERLDVEEILTDALERHAPRAEKRRQVLRMEPLARSTEIRADEEAICEILDNLIDNAVKYTPEGGSIEIRCQEEGNEVVISVTDSGIGIPQEDLPRIFERFYRVDKARSREIGGTGLGLAIVKHLVHAMRGTVSVESRDGEGTTFTLRFPQAPVGDAAPEPPREAPPPRRRHG